MPTKERMEEQTRYIKALYEANKNQKLDGEKLKLSLTELYDSIAGILLDFPDSRREELLNNMDVIAQAYLKGIIHSEGLRKRDKSDVKDDPEFLKDMENMGNGIYDTLPDGLKKDHSFTEGVDYDIIWVGETEYITRFYETGETIKAFTRKYFDDFEKYGGKIIFSDGFAITDPEKVAEIYERIFSKYPKNSNLKPHKERHFDLFDDKTQARLSKEIARALQEF